MELLNNFKVRIVPRLPVTNTTFILVTCTSARSLIKQYVFHLCSGQGSDPYCCFPVNPFVAESDLSFKKKKKTKKKKKILMPTKYNSVKVNG